jgi:YVTN family beta-propeller protein
MTATTLSLALLLTWPLSAAPASATVEPMLRAIADVPLGGKPTRMDYASLDVVRQRLFIAHLGDSAVIVFDTKNQQVVARIPGIAKVHGVLAIPDLGKVYASATGSDEVVAIDEDTLKITARIPAGDYPDGIAYAPPARKIYVSDEHGGTDTVISVDSDTRVATIALGGEVGNTQYDPTSGHVFANVQTRGQLVEIDPGRDVVLARIELPGARGNHGLLIEPVAQLAFAASEDSDQLMVINLRSRKVVATLPTGHAPDVLAFDPGLQQLYVASESGELARFAVTGSNIEPSGRLQPGPNAHSVTVDPATHRLYFPLANMGGHTVLRIMQAGP